MMTGTDNVMGLKRLMNKLNDTAKNFGIKINVQKAKFMVIRWDGFCVVNTRVDRHRIEQVKSFKYFGSIITEDGRSHGDVKVSFVMANDAFNNESAFNKMVE